MREPASARNETVVALTCTKAFLEMPNTFELRGSCRFGLGDGLDFVDQVPGWKKLRDRAPDMVPSQTPSMKAH